MLKEQEKEQQYEQEEQEQEQEEQEYTDTNDLFEGDLITITDKPTTDSWKFTPLFREGTLGEIRVWQIGFDFPNSQLKMFHGSLITSKGENGKLIEAFHPIQVNKSGRNLQEQALLEARKRYLDQYASGYTPKGEDLPDELNGTEPMLAKTLSLSSNTNKRKSNEIKFDKYPCNVSAKYDGIRALSRISNSEIRMRSRNNKTHEAPLTHIKSELEVFLKYLPVNSELDGELYSMKMDFNELSGVIRTKNTIHLKHDLVCFYIFDIIEPKQLCWEKRYTLLCNAFLKYIEDGNSWNNFRIIQTYTANSEQEMLKYHDKFVTEGYEGIIIRRYAKIEVGKCCQVFLKNNDIDKLCKKCEKNYKLTIYRSKRTNALIKHKNFVDEEVKIIGFFAGVGTEEGAINYNVLDERGNEFNVRPRGTIEYRRELFKNGDSLINLPLTIRYQELSEKGVPRFPVGISVRNYE